MTALFQLLVQMSVGAALIVLVVLAVRTLLHKAPKWFSYLLWSAVWLRLLFPIGFTSEFSVFRWLGRGEQPSTTLGYMPDPSGWSDYGLSHLSAGLDWASSQFVVMNQGVGLSGLLQLGAVIWVAGVVVMVGWHLVTTIRLRQRIRLATRVRVHIYECETVRSPFVFGLFRPRIYLPSRLTEQESAYMIAHEQTHISRGDHWVKAIASVLLIIHWFNPLVWVAYSQMSKDMEMSCDERVLRKMGPAVRQQYARSLLSLATAPQSARMLGFGQNHVKARILHVLKDRPRSLRMNLLYGLLAAIVLAGCTTNPLPGEQVVQEMISDYDAKRLMASQTPYVGNASKVGSLIQQMPSPDQMRSSMMELHTMEPPYGLTMHYEWTGTGSVGIDAQTEQLFYRNAMLLLSLIDNVDTINFHVSERDSSEISDSAQDEGITISYTRQQAEERFKTDLRQYAKDQATLQVFIDELQAGMNK